MKILMVLTSHDRLGDTGKKTGFWLEEFAAPYYVLKDAGHEITLASPKGGQPPVDPKSDEPASQTDATRRFRSDQEAQAQLASTERLDSVRSSDFDGVFYPGGHGPLWDLAEDPQSKALIEQTLADGKPVALVCHAPAVLKNVTANDGSPFVAGKRVTGFTDEEEEAVGLTAVVPFLLEDVLKQLGAKFSKAAPFKPHVVSEGLLITGQNPASSEPAAEALLEALTRETARADA
jgi:putative intracellular protease/amidase